MNDLAIWTIIVCAIVLSVVDGYLLLYGDEGSSISGQVRLLARQYPVIPFAAGCMIAHWFGF